MKIIIGMYSYSEQRRFFIDSDLKMFQAQSTPKKFQSATITGDFAGFVFS